MVGAQLPAPEEILPLLVVQAGESVGSTGAGIGPMTKVVLAQVSVLGGPALAPGGFTFSKTVTVSLVIQPVAVLVMLNI